MILWDLLLFGFFFGVTTFFASIIIVLIIDLCKLLRRKK